MRSTCFVSCALAAWLAVLAMPSQSLAQQGQPLVQPQMVQPRMVQPPAGQVVPREAAAAPGRFAAGQDAGGVQQASHMQQLAGDPAFSGETVYYDGGPLIGHDFGGSCGPGGCTHCGRFGCSGAGPLGGGCMSGLFVRAEYLGWSAKGMNLPALVTTSPDGTPRADAGVLGEPGTVILFGAERLGDDMRSGGRITFGRWFDPCQRLGVEGEYFAIGDETNTFAATSNGDTILARPFYDVLLGTESAELIAFPNLIQGTIAADHTTSFQGAGVRAVYNLCCGDGCGVSCVTGCAVQTGYRFNLISGYRFLRLDDRVNVVEDLVSVSTAAPGAFLLRDRFASRNEFHGWDFGSSLNFCKGCWSLDLLSKVALGNTRSQIDIDGSTIITEQGQAQEFQGGLLAQRTNIGTHIADEFSMVPELGATVGYQLNPCWRVTFGYSFIYWSRVLRAGDVISPELNPDLLPPEEGTVDTHLSPGVRLCYDDFWAQGLNFGLEGKW